VPASPEPPCLAGCLDGGLLDGGDLAFEVVGIARAHGNESGAAEHAVPSGEVGFLLEHVLILRRLLCVLDQANALSLGRVGDVVGLLLADVPGGAVCEDWRVEECEGSPDS
jgi:hypothetical protein